MKDELCDGNERGEEEGDDGVEVGKGIENVGMGVENCDNVCVVKKLYEGDGDEKEKEGGVVKYNNTYTLRKGIDLGEKDGKVFDVRGGVSGRVVEGKKDGVVGDVVEIEDEDGLWSV